MSKVQSGTMSGNRGEWSEIYTFFKLLGDGELYAADENLEKMEDVYYPIIKILREEEEGNWDYVRENSGRVKVVRAKSNDPVLNLPADEFTEKAHELLWKIRNAESSSFKFPEVEEFMRDIKCTSLKSSSQNKRDITIKVHDLFTGHEPELGFSIKSRLGRPSTLFNASQSTNFIYKISPSSITFREKQETNNITARGKIQKRVQKIRALGYKLNFNGTQNDIFKSNLQVIDSKLPLILSNLLLEFFKGEGRRVDKLTKKVKEINPCNFRKGHSHSFYEYKIKNFLLDAALGMTASSVWHGEYDATGGYIVIREDGEALCYHIYNLNEFKDYLFDNTKLETPSSSRHNYGLIYEEDGEYYFKLNLQVRFT